jgi:hypothetical protein
MTIEEYKSQFLELFKSMQEEFKSNISLLTIWHTQKAVFSDGDVRPEKYEISIKFGDY